MPKLLLVTAGTATLLSAVAMLTPQPGATMSLAPATMQIAVGKRTLAEETRMACTHRRVCRQGRGCAWRKVCKRW
jgi:hypothetical protein